MSTKPDRELRFAEGDARAVLFVQALEEVDRGGEILARAERQQATAEAFAAAEARGREGEKADREWIPERARQIVARLAGDVPFLPGYLRAGHAGRGFLLWVVPIAFVLGLLTNALGPEKKIHVLALPLLGLIVWNVAMILLLVVGPLLPRAPKVGRPWLVGFLERHVERLAERVPKQWAKGGAKRSAGSLEHWRAILRSDLSRWLPADGPLVAARVRRLLHLGALSLVVGAVAGMYLRGLAFEYLATWESTFLSQQAVDALLGVVLGPAAWVLGTQVPSPPPHGSSMLSSAAPWIHLWAMTAALFVGLPRLFFAGVDSLRIARLARHLPTPLSDAYRRRLRAAAQTTVDRWIVWPYSHQPAPKAAEALKRLLLDLAGARADVHFAPQVDYGAEVPEASDEVGGRVALFNLAQTPESEVHGEFLAAAQKSLPDGDALLSLVDGSPYRAKLGAGEATEQRLAERRKAWDRAAAERGVKLVHLELQDELAPEVLAQLAGSAWPEGTLGGAR